MRSARRRAIVALTTSTTLAVVLCWTASPAAAVTFSNTGTITIPLQGAASPYPSSISVSGIAGAVTDVNVTLHGYSHYEPADVDVLLVAPGGRSVTIMSGAGGTAAPITAPIDLTFDDSAATTIPTPISDQPVTTGTYRPTINGSGFSGPAPAPTGPYGTTLSAFDGIDPNGAWQLFVYDNFQYTMADSGSISSGWSLDVTTTAPARLTFQPKAGKVGKVITIHGGGLSGATGVSFGGTPARTFTVASDTEITAVVPVGATTGPISVTTPSTTTSSSRDFVVRHPRHASLTLNGGRAKGRVDVVDGFGACGARAPVKVQHLANRRWRTVASVKTNRGGSFSVSGLADRGKYRAVAVREKLGSGDVCLPATSPVAAR